MTEQKPITIENPPTLSPSLSPQETAALHGYVRSQMRDTATTAGALMGGIGGALMGGIWGLVSKSNRIAKTAGGLVAGAVIGAVAARFGFNQKDLDEAAQQTVAETLNQLNDPSIPEQQRAKLMQEIQKETGIRPSTQVQAQGAELAGAIQAPAQAQSIA